MGRAAGVEGRARERRRELEGRLEAVEEGRAWAVDGSSYFNRSGPRVVAGVEILAGLLHPGRCPSPPEGTTAVWKPEDLLTRT